MPLNPKLVKALESKSPRLRWSGANVLAALRGPDNGDEALKKKTTIAIRAWALTGPDLDYPWFVGNWNAETREIALSTAFQDKSYHFHNHVINAILAIDYIEREVVV